MDGPAFSSRTWKTSLKVTAEAELAALGAIQAFLQNEANPVAMTPLEATGEIRLELYTQEEPDAARLRAHLDGADLAGTEIEIELLPETDWVAHSLKDLSPVRIGRYFVFGAHDADRVPVNALALRIDAGQAFGTGHHPTTTGCLRAFDNLAKARAYAHPLDMGCGSGILAMAMARTWAAPVLAADNDPLAVRVARENARKNGLHGHIRVLTSTGFANRELHRAAPYDLIAANILAKPLMALAVDFRRHLAPGGHLVLSGLLEHQASGVVGACRSVGLRLVRRIPLQSWTTLVFARAAATSPFR